MGFLEKLVKRKAPNGSLARRSRAMELHGQAIKYVTERVTITIMWWGVVAPSLFETASFSFFPRIRSFCAQMFRRLMPLTFFRVTEWSLRLQTLKRAVRSAVTLPISFITESEIRNVLYRKSKPYSPFFNGKKAPKDCSGDPCGRAWYPYEEHGWAYKAAFDLGRQAAFYAFCACF